MFTVEQSQRSARRWIVVAIALMLISAIGASLVQSSNGNVTIKDLKWETVQGGQMSGLLFVPDGVNAENPAPAIVVSHGMYNNREMQDLNFVELSRRGYVVLSMDMYSHGWSESVPELPPVLTGMYQAVQMLAGLAYVDSSQIGITGHSLGGMSSNVAVNLDNAADNQLISAVLLNSADATYKDAETEEWTDIYGSRDIGVLAVQYDEFFFKDVDENGNVTAPRDFIKYSNAQSFLNFGQAPSGDLREANTVYTETIDGEEAMRVIYTPAITHPWSHFSARSTTATIEFFEQALGAPAPLPASEQVWQWKAFFNSVGLIGFGIFIVAFALLMVHTKTFASLRAPKIVTIREADKLGKTWFWGSLLAVAAFASLVFIPILNAVPGHGFGPNPWLQTSPAAISIWAVTVAAFSAAILIAFYFSYMKPRGKTLAEVGIAMPWGKTVKTIALALTTVVFSFACVFLVDYFFKTDFRLWVVAVKAFPASQIWVSLFPPMLLLLVFYVVASIGANSINFIKITNNSKEREWVNTAVLALFNAAPALILLPIQYFTFFASGYLAFPTANMYAIWLFPLLVILPVSTIISRKIYRVTNNPYLGGIINGVIITLISASNTLTWAG